MKNTKPPTPRARSKQTSIDWLSSEAKKKRKLKRQTLLQLPGNSPTAATRRTDIIAGKAAARAFSERAGKRGKAPPLIRRR